MTSEEKYKIARWMYNIGEEFISDIEYDELDRLYNYKTHYSEEHCPTDLLIKYGLEDKIKNLIHQFSTESITSLNSEEQVEVEYKNLNELTLVSYKLDGWSIKVNYYEGKILSAKTRNRNQNNPIDLTEILDVFPKVISLKGKVAVIGELFLNNKTFERYKDLRSIVSQRSGVRTAIANGDSEFLGAKFFNIITEESSNLNVMERYDLLQKLGFKTPMTMIAKNYEELKRVINIMGDRNKFYMTPTDGLVAENSKTQYAIRIGAWEEEINESYVTGYTFNRGMYNNPFLVDIKPVNVGDKTESKVSVTNIQRILDNDLQIGTPLVFVQRSATNSVLDEEKTKELRNKWLGNEDEFRELIDKGSI